MNCKGIIPQNKTICTGCRMASGSGRWCCKFGFWIKPRIKRQMSIPRTERTKEQQQRLLQVCRKCDNYKNTKNGERCGKGCCGKFIDILVKWQDLHCKLGKW